MWNSLSTRGWSIIRCRRVVIPADGNGTNWTAENVNNGAPVCTVSRVMNRVLEKWSDWKRGTEWRVREKDGCVVITIDGSNIARIISAIYLTFGLIFFWIVSNISISKSKINLEFLSFINRF